MITFLRSLLRSFVRSFLALRFPLRLFARGEELHTTVTTTAAAFSAALDFGWYTTTAPETWTSVRPPGGDFQRTFAHLLEMDVNEMGRSFKSLEVLAASD